MGHTRMVGLKLLFRYKVYKGPVLIKIMGHLFYGILDPGQIGPVMGNNIADSLMFFRSGELGIFARTDPFDRTVYRYRILNPIFNARDTPYRFGVSLTQTLSPERIIFTLGQYTLTQYPCHREQSRVPARGDKAQCFMRS